MGQKVHPVGFRLGILRSWDSNWYDDKDFAGKLQEDLRVRNYIHNRLKKAGISRILIDRTPKKAVITIHTSRPGIVIGRSGKEITQLEEELKQITNKEVKILIHEIKRPELDSFLLAENIAGQLEGRMSFRRAMKMAITSAMRMGAEGVRVMCGGRLGGAEIARSEQYKEGRIPLHTLRADIDYAQATAMTIYGTIGVKVWICRGEVLDRTPKEPRGAI
ncbi:MAG: 30S ribosomal protein S3 [Ignavibacteria bacterium]|nr:MAG: 30S ribosomal protein S3 [Ignavibacteria bacterium]HYQ86461.1 30S ribosomal protein S3 [Bacteroidota bacterium]